MAGRRRSFSVRCPGAGCTQSNHYDYYNQAEYASAVERSTRWRCTRHANPEQVLSPDSTERTGILVATTLYTKPDRWTGNTEALGRYWLPEGATTGTSLASGPGYKAHAGDFPEGSRLVITARIELPEEQ